MSAEQPTTGGLLRVSELGMDVQFGNERTLRTPGSINIYDLIGLGRKRKKSELEVLSTTARQLYLFRNAGLDRYDKRKKDWRGLLKCRDDLPFLVGYMVSNILEFGLDPNLDPRVFVDNRVSFTPPGRDLYDAGFKLKEVLSVKNGPARVAGSALLIHWDGIDENMVLLRERENGEYEGLLGVPGGHSDGPLDATALSEVLEETGLPPSLLRNTRPLGTADQVIFVSKNNGGKALRRYVNFIWEVDVSFNNEVYGAMQSGWRMYADYEVAHKVLTPVTEMALNMSGLL